MRHGRLKRIRRALTFYKVCYQFKEPYKVRHGTPTPALLQLCV
jgi:hypothetical protein